MKQAPSRAFSDTVSEYASRLMEIILARGNSLPRSYGFEYEFLPHRILVPDDMSALRDFLMERGYAPRGGGYRSGAREIVFEPGGQIEYLSPPMQAGDTGELVDTLEWISSMNAAIEDSTGIRYVGTDYIPGRYDAPLLLTQYRYSSMHQRFMKVDRRGPDMMKGTAAIHLHAAITSPGDVEALFGEFCRMSSGDILGMSSRRREIWDSTDNCRCGLPAPCGVTGPINILESIVEHAMGAVELGSGRVFSSLEDRDFEDFLEHLTTMFTDIRVNVKGGTMELRTPDSRPIEQFPEAWSEFVDRCEQVG